MLFVFDLKDILKLFSCKFSQLEWTISSLEHLKYRIWQSYLQRWKVSQFIVEKKMKYWFLEKLKRHSQMYAKTFTSVSTYKTSNEVHQLGKNYQHCFVQSLHYFFFGLDFSLFFTKLLPHSKQLPPIHARAANHSSSSS